MSASELQVPEWAAGYQALVSQAGLVDLGHRTQIEVTGADRAKWLHNLCTNEIRKLAIGSGCEAFLTSMHGKTLAHVFVFAESDSLLIETVPAENEKILQHLDHYLVCEQVTLVDRSQQWSELLLAGPRATPLLGELTGVEFGPARLAHARASLGQHPVSVRNVDMAGPDGFLISASSEDLVAVRDVLLAAGAVAACSEAFEAARIEVGFPLFGRDISDKNLPQEIGRDALAINFVKGCYLGQETVARIDALGHVNKSLVALRFECAKIPPAGLEVTAAGQTAGQVTSATYSPKFGSPLALGFVRRGSNASGTKLESSFGPAEVIALDVH